MGKAKEKKLIQSLGHLNKTPPTKCTKCQKSLYMDSDAAYKHKNTCTGVPTKKKKKNTGKGKKGEADKEKKENAADKEKKENEAGKEEGTAGEGKKEGKKKKKKN